MVSQGIRYILSGLFRPVRLILQATAVLVLVEKFAPLKLTLRSRVPLALAGAILQVVIWKSYNALLIERDVRRRGARRLPVLPYEKIGGIDIIQKLLHEAEHGYLATNLTSYFESLGTTFVLRTLGDDQVGTPISDSTGY